MGYRTESLGSIYLKQTNKINNTHHRVSKYAFLRRKVVDFIFYSRNYSTSSKSFNIIYYMHIYVNLYTFLSVVFTSLFIFWLSPTTPFATPTFAVLAHFPSHSQKQVFYNEHQLLPWWYSNQPHTCQSSIHSFKRWLQGQSLKPPPTMGIILALTCFGWARKRCGWQY